MQKGIRAHTATTHKANRRRGRGVYESRTRVFEKDWGDGPRNTTEAGGRSQGRAGAGSLLSVLLCVEESAYREGGGTSFRLSTLGFTRRDWEIYCSMRPRLGLLWRFLARSAPYPETGVVRTSARVAFYIRSHGYARADYHALRSGSGCWTPCHALDRTIQLPPSQTGRNRGGLAKVWKQNRARAWSAIDNNHPLRQFHGCVVWESGERQNEVTFRWALCECGDGSG